MHILFADLWLLAFLALGGAGAIFISETGTLLGLIILAFFGSLGLWWLFDVNILSAVYHNPALLIGIVIGYLLIGAAYVVLWRWPDWLRKEMNNIQCAFESFCKMNKIDKTEQSFERFARSSDYTHRYAPSSNAETITVWIMLWPFALFWELLHRPVTWVWNTSYELVGNSLERIGLATVRRNMKFK